MTYTLASPCFFTWNTSHMQELQASQNYAYQSPTSLLRNRLGAFPGHTLHWGWWAGEAATASRLMKQTLPMGRDITLDQETWHACWLQKEHAVWGASIFWFRGRWGESYKGLEETVWRWPSYCIHCISKASSWSTLVCLLHNNNLSILYKHACI